MRVFGRWCCFVALCLLLCGCGSGKVPVDGRVFYEGKPLAGATVMFHGEGQGTGHAVTDADGYYSISSKEDNDGLPPGVYKATVGKYKKTANGPVTAEDYIKMEKAEAFKKSFALSQSELPTIYGDPQKTPLRIEVPRGGSKDLDIQLTKQGS